MALFAPRSIGLDRLPLRVVQRRLGPTRVISQMKLPRAIDRHNAFSDDGDDENRRVAWLRGLLARLLTGSESSRQQEQNFDCMARSHEARITSARTSNEQNSARISQACRRSLRTAAAEFRDCHRSYQLRCISDVACRGRLVETVTLPPLTSSH
jgi:hypothetical protein